MQTKIKDVTNFEHPPANCRICGTDAKLIKYASFSYFYCSRCKDECDVFLKTDSSPRALKGQYVIHQDNDVVLSKPGVYRLEYTDGSTEWFEYKDRFGEIRLNGELLRSSTRLTDRDLPSRKPVSLAKGPDEGEATKGNGVGAVSNTPSRFSRVPGVSSRALKVSADQRDEAIFKSITGATLDPDKFHADVKLDAVIATGTNGETYAIPCDSWLEASREHDRSAGSVSLSSTPPDPVL
jgi:hypothetical protein